MFINTRLILNLPAQPERFEHCERADYDIDHFEKEFLERLYSEKGREILRSWRAKQISKSNSNSD